MAEFFDEFDGRLVVTSNRHRGIWANIVVLRNARTTKNAGMIPHATATHDTLLAIALTSALSGVSPEAVRNIRELTGRVKPRIQIHTTSQTFADIVTTALSAKLDPRKNGFRCAHNFVLPLFRQLMRFDVSFAIDQPKANAKFRQWAVNTLTRDAATFAPVFAPQAAQLLAAKI